MANSRLVIKGQVTNALTQVNGFSYTRYSNFNCAYGQVNSGLYTVGDFFYFGALPSKKLIRAQFISNDATPIVKTIYPGYNFATPVVLNSTAGTAIGFSYVLEFDSNFSGAPNTILKLQVN